VFRGSARGIIFSAARVAARDFSISSIACNVSVNFPIHFPSPVLSPATLCARARARARAELNHRISGHVNDNARESESLVSNRDKKHATFVASERFARVGGTCAHERRRSQRSGLSYRSESLSRKRRRAARRGAARRDSTPGIFFP